MRNSFVEPIAELDLAAKLLDAAADSLLIGDRGTTASLIALADRSEILQYTLRICSGLSDEVHGRTKLTKGIPKEARDTTRMPGKEAQYLIFRRDGWRCRYCGIKVISTAARRKLVAIFPEQTKWARKEFERHSSLYAMAASLDHIVPHSRGGKNEPSNFVTACYCCQFGRGNFTLEEVRFNHPLQRPPIVTGWDGLSRLEKYAGAS
jgi:hypothetical protein